MPAATPELVNSVISCESSAPSRLLFAVVAPPALDVAEAVGEASDVGRLRQVGRHRQEERAVVVLLDRRQLTHAPHLPSAARLATLRAGLDEQFARIIRGSPTTACRATGCGRCRAEARASPPAPIAQLDQPVGQVVHQRVVAGDRVGDRLQVRFELRAQLGGIARGGLVRHPSHWCRTCRRTRCGAARTARSSAGAACRATCSR